MESGHFDARIIGLKLLNRLERPAEETTKWIDRALRSDEEDELIGGLYELGEFLTRASAGVDYQNIKAALALLAASSDDYVRERAAEYLFQIDAATQS